MPKSVKPPRSSNPLLKAHRLTEQGPPQPDKAEFSKSDRDPAKTYFQSPVADDIDNLENHKGIRLTNVVDGSIQVDTDDYLILPSLRVRQLFRLKPAGFNLFEAAQILLVRPDEASWLLVQLEGLKYIAVVSATAASEQGWIPTSVGKALAAARTATSLDRVSGISLLVPFAAHVAAVNARTDLAYRVSGLTLIGEILSAGNGEEIPHLEVTVILSPRHYDPAVQQQLVNSCLERAKKSCSLNGIDYDDLCETWAVIEVQDALRKSGLPVALRWQFD